MYIGTGLNEFVEDYALASHESASAVPHLTPTQFKVLRCVHSGLLNKQIAYELGMAEATVKVHMTALMRKLNVRNRTQVAVAANRWNLCVAEAAE